MKAYPLKTGTVVLSVLMVIGLSACGDIPQQEQFMSRDEQIMAIHQCMSADLNPHVIYGRARGIAYPVPKDVSCEPKWK